MPDAMFICQQRRVRPAGDQPFRSPSVYGGAATGASALTDYSSSATSTTTNASTTTTECSPTLAGCLANVMGAGGACLELEKRTAAAMASVAQGSADAATVCAGSGGGVRKRQRRRRRPIYFVPGSSIASSSPDGRSSLAEGRRRRPVQPWHIQQQQQQQSRMREMQCRMANLSTACPSSFGGDCRQRPVTLVDSSWWPVSMPAASVRIAASAGVTCAFLRAYLCTPAALRCAYNHVRFLAIRFHSCTL